MIRGIYLLVRSETATQTRRYGMSADDKKAKILAAIASRGWFTAECYWNEACELRNAGMVRLGERFSTGGNRKPVWVKA